MSRSSLIFVFFGLSLIFYGCKKGHQCDCLKGTGDEITETRSPGYFDGLRVEDHIDVELIDSTENFVEITAGAKVMDGITTEIQNNILVIRNENTCNFVRDYRRNVSVKVYGVLKDIWHDSDGTMTNKNYFSKDTIFFHQTGHDATFTLNNQYFWCDMYQTGSVTLLGSCNRINLALTSFGYFYGEELNCKVAQVTNKGEGDIYVFATDTLSATIERVGNIYFSGNPQKINVIDHGEGGLYAQ